jgi:uncharacterized protein YkwD
MMVGAGAPLSQQIQAHLWVVSHNGVLRYRVLIALAGLGVVAVLWAKPELRRELQSKILRQELGADAGSGSETSDELAAEGRDAVVLPGSHLSFELMSAPQANYLGALEEDAGDREFRELVRALAGTGGEYDPWLSRAARELAYQGALLGDSPPEAALSFILRASGSPEMSVAQVVVRAKGEDPQVISDAISRALRNAPAGAGELVVGIGEAATDEERYDRRVVVVVARREFSLEPTPRSVEPDSSWRIRGRGPANFHDAHASVLYPDLQVVDIPIEVEDGRFSVAVPTRSDPGTLRVSIDGVGDEGPFKLLQLESEIGSEPPWQFEFLVPEKEHFADIAAAETYALQLLNEDRRELGLPALMLDTALSEIARGHSTEMRDLDYFAHLSPTSGLAGDRLARAQYRTSAHGENLALNDSVYEAEASLLESVGHRRNIINTSMTHVGIGLAKGEGGTGSISWYLTQLFVRKTVPLDPAASAIEFLERINSARRDATLEEVASDEALTRLAEEGCRRALATQVEDLPSWLAPKASRLAKSSVAVSVQVFYDFASLEPGASTLGEDATRVGLSFLRDEDDLHGKTILVVIAAE